MNSDRDSLRILQCNVMKSREGVMATLLWIQEFDILALQELWRKPFLSTTHNPISELIPPMLPFRSKRNSRERVPLYQQED